MNRPARRGQAIQQRVPRACGDEPGRSLRVQRFGKCSPRLRG